MPEEDEGHAAPPQQAAAAQPSGFDVRTTFRVYVITPPHSPKQNYDTTAQHLENGHPPIPDFAAHDDSQDFHRSEPEIHVDAPSTPPPEIVRRQEPVRQESPPEPEPPVVNVNVHTPQPVVAQPPPPPPPAPVTLDPNPELVAKLNDAHAEIERLRNLISSMPDPSTAPPTAISATTTTELRHRKRALSDDGSTLGPETDVGSYVDDGVMQPEGVPLQVVIVIALGVFITTYLFF